MSIVPGSETNCACPVAVSTPFIFESVQFQNAAESVQEAKKQQDANPTNVAKGRKQQFKTDFERMQYIIGLQGRNAKGLR